MTSTPKRISIPAVAAYTGFVAAMLYLLGFQFSSDVPIYSHGSPPTPTLIQTTIFNRIDSIVAAAAAGQPIAYHVNASPDEWAEKRSSNYLTAFYSLVYNQYPNRVWVGDGSAIINFPADMHQADTMPSDSWLHHHRIQTVVTLIPDDQNGPQLLIHRVP